MKLKKKIVVLSGAGISAESGLATFRGNNGLWEGYDVMEVATPEAWHNDFKKVLKFYNERRRGVAAAKPNEAHFGLAALEKHYDVTVVTQNIDNLHEQAGSSHVIHLHGEITKACSSVDLDEVQDIGFDDIEPGMLTARGHQMRPFIVWFGEAVPMMNLAMEIVQNADIIVVIGTSLEVYPAASLVRLASNYAKKYVVDPTDLSDKLYGMTNTIQIRKVATEGVEELIEKLD